MAADLAERYVDLLLRMVQESSLSSMDIPAQEKVRAGVSSDPG